MMPAMSLVGKSSFAQAVTRPFILLLHCVLLMLIITGTRQDREWNMRVQRIIPSPDVETLLHCTDHARNASSICCVPRRLDPLTTMYHRALSHHRSMDKLDFILVTCSLAIIMCVGCYVLELGFMQQINPADFCHCLVNRLAIGAYIFALFLLSHAIVGMPGKNSAGSAFCTDHYPKDMDRESRTLGYCFKKIGGCRDRDFLIVSLICMTLCPFVMIGFYLLAGVLNCFGENYDVARSMRSTPPTVQPTRNELPNNMTTVPSSVKAQCRQEFSQMLNTLHRNPTYRNSESFLGQLSISFRNYIRSGYFPTLSASGPPGSKFVRTSPNRHLSQITILHNDRTRQPLPSISKNLKLQSKAREDSPPKYEEVIKKNVGYETWV